MDSTDIMKLTEEKGLNDLKEKYHCKITVLKCDFNADLYKLYPYGAASSCGRLKVGQEFITPNRWDPPEGICGWAWRDILPIVQQYHEGRENPSVHCCTDGLRPVTFKLEKIEVK